MKITITTKRERDCCQDRDIKPLKGNSSDYGFCAHCGRHHRREMIRMLHTDDYGTMQPGLSELEPSWKAMPWPWDIAGWLSNLK